jgi:hypothetical protein
LADAPFTNEQIWGGRIFGPVVLAVEPARTDTAEEAARNRRHWQTTTYLKVMRIKLFSSVKNLQLILKLIATSSEKAKPEL